MPRPTLHRIPALAALLACALLALLPAAPAAAAPARVIAVAGDNNFPPFEFVAADGEFRGFDVEILESGAIQAGRDVRLLPMPWEQALQALKEGRVDAIEGIKFTRERQSYFLFSDPYLTTSHAIFVQAGNQTIHGPDDLQGKRVAVQRGDYASDLLRGRPGVQLQAVADQDAALALLLAGQADAFVGDRLTGIYLLQRGDAVETVKIVGDPIDPAEYGFAVRPGDGTLVQALNAGLKAIRSNGTYDKVYNKWFGEFVARPSPWPRRLAVGRAALLAVALAGVAVAVRWSRSLQREVARRTGEIERVSGLNAAILDSVPIAVVSLDQGGVVLLANAAALALAGAPALTGRPLHGTPLAAMVDPTDVQAALAAGRGCRGKERAVADGDSARTYRYSIDSLQGGRGGIVIALADVSLEREMEQRLAQHEKLRSLSHLVAGLAHEIRNPLTALQTFAQLLPSKFDQPEFRRQAASMVPQEIQRVNLLVSELIDYARPRPPAAAVCPLAETVQAVLGVMQARLEQQGVQLAVAVPPDLQVWADPGHLRQILLNVLLNALQAVPAGSGRVELQAAPAAGGVAISIADNGRGIDPADRAHLFEPFFTRRADGTGLGLYLTYQFTRRSGGEVDIQSQPRRGTRVRLWFPAAPKAAAGAED